MNDDEQVADMAEIIWDKARPRPYVSEDVARALWAAGYRKREGGAA